MTAVVAQRSYNRPSSVKLAGVKHGLYNPLLPTLRKMDMDTVAHKLSTEHSRTTILCSKDDFLKARSTLLVQKAPKLHCKKIIDKNTDVAVQTYVPHSHTDSWNKILASLNTNKLVKKQTTQTEPDLKISGLAMRSKHPSITSSWQYSRPVSAQGTRPFTPRPMSASMYSRYRTTRPYSAIPWR